MGVVAMRPSFEAFFPQGACPVVAKVAEGLIKVVFTPL